MVVKPGGQNRMVVIVLTGAELWPKLALALARALAKERRPELAVEQELKQRVAQPLLGLHLHYCLSTYAPEPGAESPDAICVVPLSRIF
jgi:hypothetical protein